MGNSRMRRVDEPDDTRADRDLYDSVRRTDENTNVAYTTQVSLPPPFADRIRALADDDAAVEAVRTGAFDAAVAGGGMAFRISTTEAASALRALADHLEGA